MELLACQLHRMWMQKVEGHRWHVLLWQPTSSSYKLTNSKQKKFRSHLNFKCVRWKSHSAPHYILNPLFFFFFPSVVAQKLGEKKTTKKKTNPTPKQQNKNNHHHWNKTKQKKTMNQTRNPPKPKPKPRSTNDEATAKQNPLFPKDLKFPLNFMMPRRSLKPDTILSIWLPATLNNSVYIRLLSLTLLINCKLLQAKPGVLVFFYTRMW